MLEVAQGFSIIIFGFLVVLILCWILVIVHKQAKRMKELEQRMNSAQKAKETEAKNG